MTTRAFDIIVSAIALLLFAPVILLAGLCVRLSSKGPAFYEASRVGKDGHRFAMYKLRTMHCREVVGSSITAAHDPRVFFVGRVLRLLKIDELPQFWNILKGDMAIVGPRPEAVDIVEHYYNFEYQKTLQVRPGLTGPGSVYYYTHGEQILSDSNVDAEDLYVTRLLPEKMALELHHLQHRTALRDLLVILHTASVLLQKAVGRRHFPKPAILQAPLQIIEFPVVPPSTAEHSRAIRHTA
ncbi:MAG: sugar transferase [Planctomycetaceae bacterium]